MLARRCHQAEAGGLIRDGGRDREHASTLVPVRREESKYVGRLLSRPVSRRLSPSIGSICAWGSRQVGISKPAMQRKDAAKKALERDIFTQRRLCVWPGRDQVT